MRTPATAAREAVEGKDETLWQACMDRLTEYHTRNPGTPPWPMSTSEAEKIIQRMSPEERRLYDIQEEQ